MSEKLEQVHKDFTNQLDSTKSEMTEKIEKLATMSKTPEDSTEPIQDSSELATKL